MHTRIARSHLKARQQKGLTGNATYTQQHTQRLAIVPYRWDASRRWCTTVVGAMAAVPEPSCRHTSQRVRHDATAYVQDASHLQRECFRDGVRPNNTTAVKAASWQGCVHGMLYIACGGGFSMMCFMRR